MKILLNIIILCFCSAVFSQYSITGIILNYDGTPIQNVKTFNTDNTSISLSDVNGIFKLFALNGDTILFSCIGYKEKQHIITDTDFIFLRMQKDTIYLHQLDIIAYPSFDEMKQTILNMETENYETMDNNIAIVQQYDTTLSLIELPDPYWEPYPGVKIHWLYLKTTVDIYAFYEEVKRTSKKRKLAKSGEMPEWDK
ncbi:MAG: hypothetical protein H7Y00_12730 [Fimbriimonadaceae bacterium]|nr:hypothetical protein [Chitinophagales bacterium]